ncbi:gene transfer agent family protein [Kaistia defluvii]|uniref:Gene transfer agent family protein n=1 Tax=Kaistia defluvii TaxID=410841 RepID=A0ABV2R669_9HYPH
MSRDGSVSFAWGDGEHRFRLAIGEWRELQEKTGVGPAELLQRVSTGRWRVDDIRETLRVGLIGGGMKPLEALGLVTRYVDVFPLMDNVPAAQAVLITALVGPPEEPVGKREPAEATTEATEMDASPSPNSMAPEPS